MNNEDRVDIKHRFDNAVDIVKAMPKAGPVAVSTEEKLKFYSLYKQATVGQCFIPSPSSWDIVGKEKWKAWNALGAISPEEAKRGYIDQLCKIINKSLERHDISILLDSFDGNNVQISEKFRILGYEMKDQVELRNICGDANRIVFEEEIQCDNLREMVMQKVWDKITSSKVSSSCESEYQDALEYPELSIPKPTASLTKSHENDVIAERRSQQILFRIGCSKSRLFYDFWKKFRIWSNWMIKKITCVIRHNVCEDDWIRTAWKVLFIIIVGPVVFELLMRFLPFRIMFNK